jgi:GNAT superfamily N-acetyltransferase
MSKIVECSVTTDAFTDAVSKAFDYTFDGKSRFTCFDKPAVPEEFKIGLIVGPSGSGKSLLLDEFGGGEKIDWDKSKAVISHFSSPEEALDRFGAVALNSIPSLCRPYHVLSNGEKYRAEMARRLKNGAVFDEFTSVVDRDVAKSLCNAIRRYVDRVGLKGLVFASPHYDIVSWLRPDWVFDTMHGDLAVGRSERRPDINLEIFRCKYEAWEIFKHHHYLSEKLNKAARCFMATWNGVPVAFAAFLFFPHPHPRLQNSWRLTRLVVDPSYQGLGLGSRVMNYLASLIRGGGKNKDGTMFVKTAHPNFVQYCESKKDLYRPTAHHKQDRSKEVSKSIKWDLTKRYCGCFEYVGPSHDGNVDLFWEK